MEKKEDIKEILRRLDALEQKRIRQTDLLPGAVTPRILSASDEMAEGDLYYSNGTTFERIEPGEEGQVLTMVDGIPTWQTP